MTLWEITILATALSIDSMAVSLSGSVSAGRLGWNKVSVVALTLAAVQAALLLAGYYAGDVVSRAVETYGKWLGFAILLYVGFSMIREAVREEEEGPGRDFSNFGKIFLAAVATSIDAFATGASFGLVGLVNNELWLLDGCTFAATVIFSVIGMLCGSAIGRRFGRPAKIAAGIVLVAIGINMIV